ncbi:MAG: hypothetical protein J6A46_00010 [Clostridia bacterium]|nr:hypothetical protein [Clostridia bacterium]
MYSIVKNAKLLQKYIGLTMNAAGAKVKKKLAADCKLLFSIDAICGAEFALLQRKQQDNPFHRNERGSQNRCVCL